jgi:hypothetical protein
MKKFQEIGLVVCSAFVLVYTTVIGGYFLYSLGHATGYAATKTSLSKKSIVDLQKEEKTKQERNNTLKNDTTVNDILKY